MNIINVGSINPIKVMSVEETLEGYEFIKPFKIFPVEVISRISEQPISLEETITGAKNRSKDAFVYCKYSFGIESGLMSVPQTKTGCMDVCVCAIYDGNTYHLGISSAFEPPREVVRLVFEKGMDLNDATHHLGLSANEKVGSAEGLIGILTKNRVTRKDYTQQAIRMALMHLENPSLY